MADIVTAQGIYQSLIEDEKENLMVHFFCRRYCNMLSMKKLSSMPFLSSLLTSRQHCGIGNDSSRALSPNPFKPVHACCV